MHNTERVAKINETDLISEEENDEESIETEDVVDTDSGRREVARTVDTARADDVDFVVCGSCGGRFKKNRGLEIHLSKKPVCKNFFAAAAAGGAGGGGQLLTPGFFGGEGDVDVSRQDAEHHVGHASEACDRRGQCDERADSI